MRLTVSVVFFFFKDTATAEIYTLSLHDALPILFLPLCGPAARMVERILPERPASADPGTARHLDPDVVNSPPEALACAMRERSEEHTSELQSRQYLVCRLLLEKKKHKLTLHRNA